MPYSYSSSELRLTIVLQNSITWHEMFSATGVIFQNKNFTKINEVIIDFSKIKHIETDVLLERDLNYMNSFLSKIDKKLHFALIATTPSTKKLAKSYSRFINQLRPDWSIYSFDNCQTANTWLEETRTQVIK